MSSLGGQIGTVVQEVFTDGVAGGAGSTGGGSWTLNGPGTAFRAPATARPFGTSLSLELDRGGGSFADGAQWRAAGAILDQPIGEPAVTPAGANYYSWDKATEVVVLKFRAFSDAASSSSQRIHVQVALLEENAAADFAGSPHFGHDLSLEAANHFTTSAGDQIQWVPNVENVENRVPETRSAHHSGVATAATLAGEARNLAIFRAGATAGQSNIESWGERHGGVLAPGDFSVAADMDNLADPTSDRARFNLVQVELQRGTTSASGMTFAPGATIADAQVGILDLHVGITRRTDFDLDYTHGIGDFLAWAAGHGAGGRTMLDGDANNDGSVDEADLTELLEHWGEGPGAVELLRYGYDTPERVFSAALTVVVDVTTGLVQLVGDGSAPTVLAYRLTSVAGGLVAGAAEHRWDGEAGGRDLHLSTTGEASDLDPGLAGAVVDAWSLGHLYAVGADTRDLVLEWQPSLGSATLTAAVLYIPEPRSAVVAGFAAIASVLRMRARRSRLKTSR